MNIFSKMITLTQAALLVTSFAFAGNKGDISKDSSRLSVENAKCLEVRIFPTEKDMFLSGVVIKIYHDNDIVCITNNAFLTIGGILFERNKHYSIEVSKTGYYPKLVSISTIMPARETGEEYEFDLQIELTKVKAGIESFYLDFPVALIAYNSITDLFNYSPRYTSGIVRKVNQDMGAGVLANYNLKIKTAGVHSRIASTRKRQAF